MSIGQLPQSFRGYVGIAKESAYAGGATPAIFVDVTSDGFGIDNQTDYINTTRSRAAHKGEAGAFSIEGSIDAPANPENGLGLVLLGALGAESYAEGATTAVGVHTFTPSDDGTLDSLAVEIDRDTEVSQHLGVGVNSLELSHTSEEMLTWSADMPAADTDPTVTASTPTYSDLRNFRFQDATLSAAGTDRSADLQDLTITIENNLDPLHRGDRTAGKMSVGERVITVSLTLDMETAELYKYALGASDATGVQASLDTLAINATWTSPESIGSTSTGYELEFNAPAMVPNTHEANLDTNSLVGEDVELRAVVDSTLGAEAEVVLTNGVTSAY